jgi:hypothetical protein
VGELKKKVAKSPRRSVTGACAPDETKVEPKLVVAFKQQTLEEERRFDAAVDLLLSEWVRQRLGREGKTCTKN